MARETVRDRKARLERGGEWLRAQRQQRGWTGVEFARRLSVDQAKLSAYENGRYEVDVSVARSIARALEISELQAWRGLELPLPRDLTEAEIAAMSREEVIAYVNERWPGAIEEIISGGNTPGPPTSSPRRMTRGARKNTRMDDSGREATHG